MRRFRIVRAILVAGVVLGFGSGIFSVAHHLAHHHRDRGAHCGGHSR